MISVFTFKVKQQPSVVIELSHFLILVLKVGTGVLEDEGIGVGIAHTDSTAEHRL